MVAKHTEQHLPNISQEQLLTFVRTMLGGSTGREDDEHPLPHGPWDPHIRIALERISPHPEPWKTPSAGITLQPVHTNSLGFPNPWSNSPFDSNPSALIAFASILARFPALFDVLGGGHSFGQAALNPQSLPPRFAFLVALAQTVISRAELFQELANAMIRGGEKQGSKIVGSYIGQFSDDFCGNGFVLRWPFPWPPPPWWFHELTGIDLVVLATQFDQASKEAFSPDLSQSLADASAQLTQAGMSRM